MASTRLILGTPNQSNKTPGSTYYWGLAQTLTKMPTNEATAAILYKTAWTASQFEVNVYNNDTTGNSTIKLGVGTSTPLTYTGTPSVTFTADLEGWMSDLTSTVSFNGSTQYGAIQVVCSSGGTEFTVGAIGVTCTTAGSEYLTIVMAQGCEVNAAATERYGSLTQGGPWSNTAPVAERQNPIDFNCVARNMQCLIGTNAHSSSITVGLMVDGVLSDMQREVPANTTGQYNYTASEITIPAGSLVNWYLNSGAGTGFVGGGNTTVELVSTTPQTAYWANWGAAPTYNAGATYYFPLSAVHGSQRTTQTGNEMRMRQQGVISNLKCYVVANTLSGDCNVTLYKNGSATALTKTIFSGTGLFENITDNVTYDEDDLLCWGVTTGAGTSIEFAWFSVMSSAAVSSTTTGALDFSSGGYVDFGSGATLDNLAVFTVAFWMTTTSTTAEQVLLSKGPWKLPSFYITRSGQLRWERDRGTQDTDLRANLSDFTAFATGTHIFVALVYDAAGTDSDNKLFVGNLTQACAEPAAYTKVFIGSGALTDDSAETLRLGPAGSATNTLAGTMSWVGLWNRALSSEELHAIQFRPRPTQGCVLFSHLGLDGSGTERDLSGQGNVGTTTTATATAERAQYRLFFDAQSATSAGPAGTGSVVAAAIEDALVFSDELDTAVNVSRSQAVSGDVFSDEIFWTLTQGAPPAQVITVNLHDVFTFSDSLGRRQHVERTLTDTIV